ncbi:MULTISPECIES: phage virion morphogenesis protein [unclassified Bradyrhizobium]|uniref:phage virion morphogenesis protein n=1 Tax=unclassified Bradyrhizobium TaxID=2631580 RepID=UPI0029168074|nr:MULTISPECIES: phage virion morphogenesis protein [unclassified Bradyrhizobium]
MGAFAVDLNTDDLARLNARLTKLLHDAEHLHPVMEQAAEYMQRATINRILRTKMSPEGERWAALSDVTIALKGHDRPLFDSGELSRSIDVTDVADHGFELTADTEYASWMQNGFNHAGRKARRGGKRYSKSDKVPARPFMGFSEENVKRISKMIRDYLAHGG